MDARESHVFSHLFDLSLLRFPLLRRIKGNGKKIVDSYRRYNFLERRTVRHARKKKKKKEFGKEIEEPNYRKKVPKRRRRDKRRLEKHNFIFQLPKQLRIHYPSIHCQQANTTPTKTHRTIAPKEPFTSLYVEA